jgi:hypothetical protein
MDQKTLIEMKNQAKLWDRIDSKMEDKIKSLKATGTFHVPSYLLYVWLWDGVGVPVH